jgi:hypothetical protein
VESAALIGLAIAMVGLSVLGATLALFTRSLWAAYERRTDAYVDRTIDVGNRDTRLAALRAELDAADRTIAKLDKEIAILVVANRELGLHAVSTASDSGLVDLGNRSVLPPDGGGGASGRGAGPGRASAGGVRP